MRSLREASDGMATELVELLASAWRSLDNLCTQLSPRDWGRSTDCPGWTVKDIMSHIAGTESWLLGRPLPPHEPEVVDHIRNELGRINEVQVDFRRPWPPEQVVAEFREVTSDRLAVLGTWKEEDLAADSWTPFGPGTAARLLEARVSDTWIHEQDIRRAVNRPGHDEGPVARHVLNDLAHSGLGYVVAKKAGCTDGTTIGFTVTGPERLAWFVAVSGGRGTVIDSPAGDVQVAIETDQQTYLCLVGGRRNPTDELESGRVAMEGDEDIGRHVVSKMSFMI
jgi:uncharacterized protein (TIGR03083 family)